MHGSIGVIALGYACRHPDRDKATALIRALRHETNPFVTDAVIECGDDMLDEQSQSGLTMEHKKVDLEAKLAQFDEQWSPKLVGELNGQAVKLAKLEGEFVWHHHVADELFLVLDGHLTIELREGSVDLGEGEFFIVPRGVEHKPVADGEAHVLLFEPAETRNTGNVANERTSDVESL